MSEQFIDLMGKARNLDKELDFKILRVAYTQTENYKPYLIGDNVEEKMNQAMAQGNLEEAKKFAQMILDENPLHPFGHFLLREDDQFHAYMFMGLMNGILSSGDGTTFKTAFQIINVIEEYLILDMLGFEFIEQNFVENEDGKYDVIKAKKEGISEEVEVYFDVSLPHDWLLKQKNG